MIPQLIARIDTPRQLVSQLVVQLLTDIGKAHPQALIYPLTVAAKSNTVTRKTVANRVLKSMCEHSNTLVQQALLVCIKYVVVDFTAVVAVVGVLAVVMSWVDFVVIVVCGCFVLFACFLFFLVICVPPFCPLASSIVAHNIR